MVEKKKKSWNDGNIFNIKKSFRKEKPRLELNLKNLFF